MQYVNAGVWLLLESCFFGVQRLRYRKFNRRNTNVPLSDLNDIQKRFDDFLTLAPVLDLREFLSGWFLGIDSASIAEDNVSEFLSYAYWYAARSSLIYMPHIDHASGLQHGGPCYGSACAQVVSTHHPE